MKRSAYDWTKGVMKSSVILMLLIAAPLFAADEDDAELGIEMKKNQGGASVAETLNKANTKIKRYEKAKTEVSQIFAGASKEAVASKAVKHQGPAGKAEHIRLKNGQSLDGTVTERDQNGVWVETDPGVKIYLRNEEMKPS